jgi:hypothetical protein
MGEHSEEPWVVITEIDAFDHGRRVVAAGRVVAECSCLDADVNDANARRIVACINALAGLPDPAAVRDLIEKAEVLLATLEKQTEASFGEPEDALRAALSKYHNAKIARGETSDL